MTCPHRATPPTPDPTTPDRPIALYWEDGDWSCSFKCGEEFGNEAGWFGDGTAKEFWDDDNSATFSVWRDGFLAHGERGGDDPHFSDYLSDEVRCVNCHVRLTSAENIYGDS